MENGLFAYILKYSKRQQIILVLLTLVSFPFYYLSLDLPKTIVNEAISGTEFPVDISVDIAGITLNFGEYEQVPYLFVLCFAFLLLVLINSGIKLIINIYRGVMGERMLRRLRLQLIGRIMKFPLARFRKTSQGELVSMVNQETEPLGGFIGEAISLPLYQGGLLLTILTFMFIQDWKLGLAAIALYPVQAWLIPKLQRQVNLLNQQRTMRMRKLAENLGEIVSGINEIHVNDNSHFFKDHFSKLLGRIFNIRVQIYKKKYLIKFLNNAIAQITPFMFFLIGGLLVIKGDLSVGALVAALAAYKDLSPPWKELLSWYQGQADARLKFAILTEQFRIKEGDSTENENENEINVRKEPENWLDTLPDSPIVANNISLIRHDGVQELSNVSLTVNPGEWICFIGAGNSGKNGLAHLLAKLVAPHSGKLIIADQDINDLSEAAIGRAIGYVGHDSYLFSTSIRENILLSLKYRPHAATIANYQRDKTIHFDGWEKEARLSGNSEIKHDTDWVDYSAVGVSDDAQLSDVVGNILQISGLEDELVRYALTRTIDPDEYSHITNRIVEARALFKERLIEKGLESLVEFLDADAFNENASLAENILFGVSNNDMFSVEGLTEHPVLRALLDELGLAVPLDDVAISTATTMIELFSDFPPGHEFFERYSFIDGNNLVHLKRIMNLVNNDTSIDQLDIEDRKLIRSLPYKIISGRHRIGNLNEIDKENVLSLRRKFAKKLDASSRNEIEFFSTDKYISLTPIVENIIFGRIVYGRLGAEEKVYRLIVDVLQELDMMSPILEIGLTASAGLGGSLLSVSQQQKILLARALIKKPDILIINEGLNSLDTVETETIFTRLKSEYPKMRLIWVDSQSKYTDWFDRSVHLNKGKIVSIDEISADSDSDKAREMPRDRTLVRKADSVDFNEKLTLLNGIPLFRFLDTPNLRLLSENCDTLDIPQGQRVFAQGDSGDALYIIIDGKANILISNGENEQKVRECGANESVGEMALLSDQPRSATVVAATDLALLRLKREIFIDLVRSNGEIAYQILQVVINRFHDIHKISTERK